jgi:DNA-binding MarR family transcriptional regulator
MSFYTETNNKKGLFIPNKLWRESNLSPSESILLVGLHNYMNINGNKTPNQALLSEFLGVSQSMVQKMLFRLEQEGYLERFKSGRKREIKVYLF